MSPDRDGNLFTYASMFNPKQMAYESSRIDPLMIQLLFLLRTTALVRCIHGK